MKTQNIVFDFVNHDTRSCLNIVMTVHSTERFEFNYDDNDLESMVKMMAWITKVEFNLKAQLKQLIKDTYFKGKENGSYDAYRLVKVAEQMEDKMVNLDSQPGDKARLRSIACLANCSIKLDTGQRPAKLLDILDYKKRCIVHVFDAKISDGDHVALKLITSYELNGETSGSATDRLKQLGQPAAPTDAASAASAPGATNASAPTDATRTNATGLTNVSLREAVGEIEPPQTGGRHDRDYDKYLKYKQKYFALKQHQRR